jgi:hypothetical protein
MESKIYCTYFTLRGLLSFFSFHKFTIFSSFVIAFLALNLDVGYLGLSCSVNVDTTDGDCGLKLFSTIRL